MKTVSIKWLQALDTAKVDEVIEEACVDCYGEDEQCSALVDMAAQELAFPFPATVMGEAVEVVDAASSKYDPQGLDLVVVHHGKHYAIAAHCVELVKPLPEGHLYFAAFLLWRARQ
ncbi:MAG: hypothetical protein WD049_08270 [Candidatus Paceibacterota bacterium]